MTLNKINFLWIILLISNLAWGQNIKISGKVVDENDKALAYVNIGIKKKNIGTISELNGDFEMSIKESNLNDSLTFSYVGYKELTLKISDILDENKSAFHLKFEPTSLSEVVIKTKKRQEKKIGTTSYVSFAVGYIWDEESESENLNNKDIREFAKEINIKKPSKVKDLNLALNAANVDSVTFRINFYDIENNLPGKKINTEEILITKKIKEGWNKFELADYDLYFDTPFFVALEYIPTNMEEKNPFIYAGQVFGKSVSRTTSLGEWKVKKAARLSLYVTVIQ